MKRLFLALSLLAFSCSNAEVETLKKANEELAVENVKLKAENKAMEAQLTMIKLASNKQENEKAPEITVQSNMYVVKEMVKLYESKKQAYPANLNELEKFLQSIESPPGSDPSGPGDITNPIQGGTWMTDGNGLKLGVASKGCNPGETYYQPMSKKGDKYLNYSITGCEENGDPAHEPFSSSVMILSGS